MKYLLAIGFVCLLRVSSMAQDHSDAILGKWIYEEKNLIVDVYKEGDDFKAKIVWFHDDDDTLTPLDQWYDKKNPDKELRNRKILGLDVLSNLIYDPREHKWVKGKIYDSTSGKTWDATVWLSDPNTMQVRGYYVFKFIGKTLTFTRME